MYYEHRATEVPQRPSPRGLSSSFRTSSSDSDPAHHRTRTVKLSEGRSPRGAQSDPLHQRKLGTRIADLESQLGQAQDELKSLKNQLVTAGSAKKAAQDQLDKKPKKQPKVSEVVEIQPKQQKHSSEANQSEGLAMKGNEASEEFHEETDVFEVPILKLSIKSEIQPGDHEELESKSVCTETEAPMKLEQQDLPVVIELETKNGEVNVLKARLAEREKQLEALRSENENLMRQLDNKLLKISAAESSIEELTLNLKNANEELEKSKANAAQVNENLLATEKAKEELEAEMRRLRVQTEQWRKAADAAASVLAAEVETNGRRISERCGSMDKHYVSAFEPDRGYTGFAGSPELMDDLDDVFGSGKRRGSGIKMFGDLWKKRGHK